MPIHKPRKLPRPVQQPDTRWVVRWRYKVSGVEHRPKRVFATEADANEFILNNLVDDSRLSPAAKARTFGAYAEAWLKSRQRKGLKASTLKHYRDKLGYALERFGTTPIKDITPTDAEDFATELTEQPGLKSPASVRGAWFPFRATLKHAVRLGQLASSPADGVELPTLADPGELAESVYHFLRPQQISALSEALPAPYNLLVRFTAYTGLRRGEVSRLDVRHVTLSAPTPTNADWSGNVRVAGDVKSRAGRRTVPLPPWLAKELHDYLENHPAHDDPDAPMWPNRKPGATYTADPATGKKLRGGFRLDYTTRLEPEAFYRNVFKPAARRIGIPGLRFHDLRHTYASLLAADGVRSEVVAKLMGHANAAITLRIYTHLWPEHLTEAATRLAAPPAPAPETSKPNNVVPLNRRAG